MELVEFVQQRTAEGDRVLLEAVPLYPWLGLALPAIGRREVISVAAPDRAMLDPIEFSTEKLFGRSLADSNLDQVREVLSRFNVNWVIVRNRPWQEFFRRLSGSSGEAIGPYEAFKLSDDRSRFLIGEGEVRAGINRLELRNVASRKDHVVLRYRFHPGWVCDAPASIECFPTPDTSGGLILVRHPAPTTVLRFDPARALSASWPAAASGRTSLAGN